LYSVSLPISALALLRAFGRSRWLALFALPMPFTMVFYQGFAGYLIAMPPAILVLAAVAAALEGRLRGIAADLAIAAASLIAVFAHVQPWAFAIAGAGWLLIALPAPWPVRLRVLLSLAPSALLAGEWLLPVFSHAPVSIWEKWYDPLPM